MKQLKIAIFGVIAFLLLCGCPNKDGHPYITFVNKSERLISCQELWAIRVTESDTLFQCRTGAGDIPSDSLCNFPSLSDTGWETDFKSIPYIQFLVMDGETYGKYMLTSCDTIRKYVPILHRYRLTLEDLERMNWRVVYPPEE